MSRNGINDPLMMTMRKYGIPVTRENYIQMNEPENLIFRDESETDMPEQLKATTSNGYARGGKVKVHKHQDTMRLALVMKKKAK